MSRVAGQYSSEEFIPRQTALKRVYAEHFSPQREVGLRNDVLGLAPLTGCVLTVGLECLSICL